MKSLGTNEWKAKSQAYSLHIPMWDINNEQTFFIKDVFFGTKIMLESGRMCESWLSYYALVTWHIWSLCEVDLKGGRCRNKDGDMHNLWPGKPTHYCSLFVLGDYGVLSSSGLINIRLDYVEVGAC